MKHIYLMAALAVCAAAADLRVDHVTFAGRDLPEMRAAFAAMGIRTEYGGKHTNGLTEMALASFADGSYLELIAAIDPQAGAPKHYWGNFIDNNAGPCAWAIRADQVEGVESGRKRPDGVELKWRSASLGPEAQGTFFPFKIQDLTDRALRAYPSGKPTMPEWRGIEIVYIAVKNLDDAVQRYRDTFQLPEPRRAYDKTVGARTAAFANTPVVLTSAKNGRLAQRAAQFGEAPCAFVIATSGGHHKVVGMASKGK